MNPKCRRWDIEKALLSLTNVIVTEVQEEDHPPVPQLFNQLGEYIPFLSRSSQVLTTQTPFSLPSHRAAQRSEDPRTRTPAVPGRLCMEFARSTDAPDANQTDRFQHN